VILDTSAIVAILRREPGHELLVDRLVQDAEPGAGAPTLAEAGIVLVARLGVRGRTLLARFVQSAPIATIPFGDDHWPVAMHAFATYGKGRHPAGLNFGDCLTYAVARVAGEPLLCVGDDFSQTDLAIA
jgi:ribonuclease VapC